jgi:hypothetical protein
MATKKGPEAAIAAVVATLTANIHAALDTIWTAWGDSATIPKVYPLSIYKFRPPPPPEYPCIIVSSLSGRQITNDMTQWGEVDHILDVTAICESDTVSVVETQATRYLWAIWEVLMNAPNLDSSMSGLAGVDLGKYGRSGAYPKAGSGMLDEAVGWEVIVHVMESV